MNQLYEIARDDDRVFLIVTDNSADLDQWCEDIPLQIVGGAPVTDMISLATSMVQDGKKLT